MNPPTKSQVTGIILAGGLSRRFGSDKAAALLAGRPLLQWVVSAVERATDELIVVSARGQVLPAVESAVPPRVVEDTYEGLGPLAGMVTGFEAAPSRSCLVLSCDAPLLEPALLRHLAALTPAAPAVIPRVAGRFQPLVAAYDAGVCLSAFRKSVEAGTLPIMRAVDTLGGFTVLEEADVRGFDPDLRSFLGVNTPGDLAGLELLLQRA